jgi:release factor glutamine methyltransferase
VTDPQDLEGTVSWRALVDETERRLAEHPDVVDASREARWITEDILDASGSDYRDLLDTLATVRGVSKLDHLVGRRLKGEPIQYVLGHWPFRFLDLLVDERVLIPRPETEVVAELALAELRRTAPDGGVAVDLGTGSGAIGLSLATEHPGTAVVLTDASADALAVARANLAGLGMAASSVQICEGEWFAALPERLRSACDVIVSNPPYVTDDADLPQSVEGWEPRSALRAGADGLDDIRQLIAGARDWLKPTGALIMEMDPEQTTEAVELGTSQGWLAEVHRDLAGRDRAVILRLKES